MTILGIIGGSGLYELPGIEDLRHIGVESPYGAPSDLILRGRLGSLELAFLPRHGKGHRLMPSGINYRANIDCLKRIGVRDILSFSACGSLNEEMAPGDFVLVDQFIDRTRARPLSFFDNGMVAHVSMAEPTCGRLRKIMREAADALGITAHVRGTYLAMEGPQFSTRAESRLYRQWGADIIGMTNLPEAKLAREGEICYLTVGMVTDYDSWREGHAHVEVADVIRVLMTNAEKAKTLAAAAAPQLARRPDICPMGCDRALDTALITAPEARDPVVLERLDAIIGRALAVGRE